MARFIFYDCPDCGGRFRHLQHPSDAPPPDRCPLCLAWVSEDEPPQEVFVPQAPGIRKSAYAKSVDQSYRAMEEASALRAEDARDKLADAYARDDRESPHEGDPRILEDMRKSQLDEIKSGLKITNMRDPSEMREGDTAVMSNGNAEAAAQRLTVGPSKPMFQNLEGAAPNYAPGVGGGSAAVKGIATATRSSHSQVAANLTRAGQMGSYRE